MSRCSCALGRGRTPPLDAAPLREKLRVEGVGFERAFGFVVRPDRINFSRIGRAQENLAGGIAGDARNLRRAGFGEVGEDTVAIDGQKSAAVTGPCEEATVGSESESVNDIPARRPKLFRCPVGADAVNAAREQWGKWTERLLRLDLAATDYAAGGDRRRALRRGDNRAGSLPGALLLANRGDVDGAIGGDRQGSDFAFGCFIEDETFRFCRCRIHGVFGGSSRRTLRDA